MNRDEILNATPERLNEWVADIIGFPWGMRKPAEKIRDAYRLEEKVKETELFERYIDELTDLIGFETIYYDGPVPTYKGLFDLAHATPEQRTKAFLIACEKTGK